MATDYTRERQKHMTTSDILISLATSLSVIVFSIGLGVFLLWSLIALQKYFARTHDQKLDALAATTKEHYKRMAVGPVWLNICEPDKMFRNRLVNWGSVTSEFPKG